MATERSPANRSPTVLFVLQPCVGMAGNHDVASVMKERTAATLRLHRSKATVMNAAQWSRRLSTLDDGPESITGMVDQHWHGSTSTGRQLLRLGLDHHGVAQIDR